MPFKKSQPPAPITDSPDQLLRTFSRRKIPDVLPHQQSILRSYAEVESQHSDIALQLPTGSGKTLVGLLIAEWVRRKHREHVVYLCSTRQLVHQAVEQSRDKYGLTVLGFVGSQRDYSPGDKASYKSGDHVAVTTYSSLFNSKPYFDDASLIIVDDAHAAEPYIADLWSIRVLRSESKHQTLHTALSGALKSHLDSTSYTRITGQWTGTDDYDWVDMLPYTDFYQLREEIIEILDTNTKDASLDYAWTRIRDHLVACNLYFSSREILIRPLISPTWTHNAFIQARQRIYMSATLGNGGDLERGMGREKIHRLAVPEGWDRQGVGRRLFLFPTMSLMSEQIAPLCDTMMRRAGRSIVLVPSDTHTEELLSHVRNDLSMQAYTARDLEESKEPFTATANAVAIIANRYDGLDFGGDECRLEFIEGLPQASNLQERFLMTRMGAYVLYNERVWTRVLQAVGRCTRSMEDYAVIVITDEKAVNYLADPQRRRFFHPELQAEIQFGIDQSRDASSDDFAEYLVTFLSNGEEWELDGNQTILALRDKMDRIDFPALKNLELVVSKEIEFSRALWGGDVLCALDAAEHILGELTDPQLQGYRTLWHYISGSMAWLAQVDKKAEEHFSAVRKSVPGLRALSPSEKLQKKNSEDYLKLESEAIIMEQIENIERVLERLGTTHTRKFSAYEKRITDGLMSKDFEQAHVDLGRLLGFRAEKVEKDGSPDPWWAVGPICLVFEDHTNAQPDSALGADKARQVKGHPDWIRINVPDLTEAHIVPVLVTPVTQMMPGAKPHLTDVSLWPLDEFRKWAKSAIAVVRDIRRTFAEPGDVDWRQSAREKLEYHKIDAPSVFSLLQQNKATDCLTVRE